MKDRTWKLRMTRKTKSYVSNSRNTEVRTSNFWSKNQNGAKIEIELNWNLLIHNFKYAIKKIKEAVPIFPLDRSILEFGISVNRLTGSSSFSLLFPSHLHTKLKCTNRVKIQCAPSTVPGVSLYLYWSKFAAILWKWCYLLIKVFQFRIIKQFWQIDDRFSWIYSFGFHIFLTFVLKTDREFDTPVFFHISSMFWLSFFNNLVFRYISSLYRWLVFHHGE